MIRKGTKEDIQAVSFLWLQMAKEKNYRNAKIDWWREITFNLFETGVYFIFVAILDNQIIGFLDYSLCPEPATGKIQAVAGHYFVLSAYRGGKISYTLYRAAHDDAKGKGAQSLRTSCILGQEKFWQKRGFQVSETLLIKEL